jgi:hypothetical protein
LVNDLTVKDSFADLCAGVTFVNGVVHITFASMTADHDTDPASQSRVVSARLVMPVAGVIDLRDTLTRILDSLIGQGVIVPPPSIITSPVAVTPV